MAPRLIGADIPNSAQSTIRPGAAVSGMPNSAQQYLSNASSILQGSLQNESQNLEKRLQSFQQTQAAVSESIQSHADTAVQVARLKQTQKPNALAGIVDSLKEYMALQEKIRLEREKDAEKARLEEEKRRQAEAQLASERDYATAFKEIQDLKVAWAGGGLDEKGVTSYTNAMTEALKKYKNLTYEQVQKLTDDGYGLAVEHSKSQASKQQKYFDDLRAATQDTTSASLMFKLSKPLADLKATPYGDSTAIMQQVDGVIAEFLDDPNVDPLTRTLALNVAMKETLESMDERNVAYNQLEQRVTAVSEYGRYAMELTQQVESGALSPQQMKLQLQERRLQLGVPSSYEDPTLFETDRLLEDSLKRQRTIKDLREQDALDLAESSQMGIEETSYLAWAIINNPGVVNQIKSSKIFSAVPGVKTAVDIANEYLEQQKERQALSLRIQSKKEELANAQSRGVTWFIGQANSGQKTSVTDYLNAAGLGIELPQDTEGITPEQAQQANAAFIAYQQEVVNSIALMENQWATMNSRLASYGLYGSKEEIDTRMKSYKGKYDAYVGTFGVPKQTAPKGVPAQKSPFEPPQAVRSNSPAAQQTKAPEFVTYPIQGKKVPIPFLRGSKVHDWDNYAEERGTHRHAGLDIAVPEGTPVVSYVNGVIADIGFDAQGYGNYVDIKGSDGMLHRFAHGQNKGVLVRKGQMVTVGQPVMRAGSTGRSTGSHLHWEIRDPSKPFGFDGTVDPLVYMATNSAKFSHTAKPRTITDDLYYLPSSASPYDPPTIPANAIPVAGGKYILNGKLHDVVGTRPKILSLLPLDSPDVAKTYSNSAPLRNGYVSRERKDYPSRNRPDANYGYKALADDKAFARKVAEVADRLGIPAQWLADVMAFETAGTFSSGIDNGVGYTGLIQFGDEAAQEMGTSRAALARMSRVEQMEYVYRYLKKFGSDIQNGVEHVLASIWGGYGLLDDLMKRGASAVLDPSWNDFAAGGGATFKSYLEGLGSHAGRKYAYLGSGRRARIQAQVHNKFTQGCKVCAALRNSNSPLIPHEAQ